MKHNFISHTTKQLFDLRTDLRGTLKNQRCEPLFVPVRSTIGQIEKELELRGIEFKTKQAA